MIQRAWIERNMNVTSQHGKPNQKRGYTKILEQWDFFKNCYFDGPQQTLTVVVSKKFNNHGSYHLPQTFSFLNLKFHKFMSTWTSTITKKTLWPLFMDAVQLPQG